jgi:hypothetical protein
MAKKIIVLERTTNNFLGYKYALWADVPIQRQIKYANTGAVSAYSDISPTELSDLRAGKFTEAVSQGSWPSGTTLNTIKSELQDVWQKFQISVSGNNPWDRYGTNWDGTTWISSGIN